VAPRCPASGKNGSGTTSRTTSGGWADAGGGSHARVRRQGGEWPAPGHDGRWAASAQTVPEDFKWRREADTGRQNMQFAAQYRAMSNDPHTLARTTCREGKWPEHHARLYKCYLAVYSLGHLRIPITTALLTEAASVISARLSINNFSASNG